MTMSRALFHQAPQIFMLTNPQHRNKRSVLPNTMFPQPYCCCPIAVKFRKGLVTLVKASSSSPLIVDQDYTSIPALEHCSLYDFAPTTSSPWSNNNDGPAMKGRFGASGGAVTLEKSKADMSQKQQSEFTPEVAAGGDYGDPPDNTINGGAGGGGVGDGGCDDYFHDPDDGDGEGEEGWLFRRRNLLEELFARKFVDAVLNEWQKTMTDLPAGLRQAYEMAIACSFFSLFFCNFCSVRDYYFDLAKVWVDFVLCLLQGLVSSAQMVKFLAINTSPTTVRFISRSLPQGISRAFIGRMLSDPAFLHKLILEQVATVGCTVWSEVQKRKDRIKQEWHLVLLKVLTASVCNFFVVWSLAPSRSYGNTTLQRLPNNIFEKSYPFREFDLQNRIQSFINKAAGTCTVGLVVEAVEGALSKFLSSEKQERSSMTFPSVSTHALGYRAFLGLNANLRYQLVNGVESVLINHFDVIGVPLVLSTTLRMLNVLLGEKSRLALLRVEAGPLVQSDSLLKAYDRPSDTASTPSSNWYISKSAIISALGSDDSVAEGEVSTTKPPRKRIVRKKVATRSS